MIFQARGLWCEISNFFKHIKNPLIRVRGFFYYNKLENKMRLMDTIKTVANIGDRKPRAEDYGINRNTI